MRLSFVSTLVAFSLLCVAQAASASVLTSDEPNLRANEPVGLRIERTPQELSESPDTSSGLTATPTTVGGSDAPVAITHIVFSAEIPLSSRLGEEPTSAICDPALAGLIKPPRYV
jgi:hypothetical protein